MNGREEKLAAAIAQTGNFSQAAQNSNTAGTYSTTKHALRRWPIIELNMTEDADCRVLTKHRHRPQSNHQERGMSPLGFRQKCKIFIATDSRRNRLDLSLQEFRSKSMKIGLS